LNSEPITSPLKNKLHTYYEDMEANVTTQQNDESINMKSDEFMEDQNELDFE
jgi:hypothetical protein